LDVYFKKEITYSFAGKKYKFDVGNTLFSTFDIDHGTGILLRSVISNNPKSILDIGCGYGPLGIILAKNNPKAEVVMVDRDLLAVRYASYNIVKNNITNATVLGSLGMETIKGKTFDLIVSNIPAKLGDDAIKKEFILDPYEQINLNGEYWIVVVSALNRLIPKIGREHHLNMKEIRKRRGHTVYKITKNANKSLNPI